MAAKKKEEDWANACHFLMGALEATPPETHPPRPFHLGGPAPKIEAWAYVHAVLWLAELMDGFVDERDRADVDLWTTVARRRLTLPKKEPPPEKDRKVFFDAAAAKPSRIPHKVAAWALHEANNWATRPIYAGNGARPAAANVAKFFLKKAPSRLPAFLAELDRRCLHYEVLSVLHNRDEMPSSPPVETPWRGHRDDKVTHWIMRLESGKYALLFKEKTRWKLHEGPRDDVLAMVDEDLFEAAVKATVSK